MGLCATAYKGTSVYTFPRGVGVVNCRKKFLTHSRVHGTGEGKVWFGVTCRDSSCGCRCYWHSYNYNCNCNGGCGTANSNVRQTGARQNPPRV
jgi:hypothetical protein